MLFTVHMKIVNVRRKVKLICTTCIFKAREEIITTTTTTMGMHCRSVYAKEKKKKKEVLCGDVDRLYRIANNS